MKAVRGESGGRTPGASGESLLSFTAAIPASCACSKLTCIICAGSSLRGLSLVMMTKSDLACATSAMCARIDRSRSPWQPNTVKIFLALPLSAESIASSDSGVDAASTMTEKSCPSSTTSQRPGMTSIASMPATMLIRGTCHGESGGA